MQALTEPGELRLQAGGTLNPRRHLYVERPDDAILLKLLSEGQYVNVLTSRQMGKSSLMVRTAESLIQRGVRCAIVDLAAELGTPEDATTYFLGLLSKIARDLKIEVDLPTWWAERVRGDGQSAPDALLSRGRSGAGAGAGRVLSRRDRQHAEAVLDGRPVYRAAWHAQRAADGSGLRAADVLLIGVAWPNELIKDRRTTPYNVGSTLGAAGFRSRAG